MSFRNKAALQQEDIHLFQHQRDQVYQQSLQEGKFRLALADPKRNDILLFKKQI